eukprot:4740974-Prymnesium_polylepis.1
MRPATCPHVICPTCTTCHVPPRDLCPRFPFYQVPHLLPVPARRHAHRPARPAAAGRGFLGGSRDGHVARQA